MPARSHQRTMMSSSIQYITTMSVTTHVIPFLCATENHGVRGHWSGDPPTSSGPGRRRYPLITNENLHTQRFVILPIILTNVNQFKTTE